jgi:hypothetical protein
MKRTLRLIVLLLSVQCVKAQITTPVVRAGFGVDADLRARFFNGIVQSGNDDWYLQVPTAGIGDFVIDTTGAAGIVARYATDINFRRIPFFRTMRVPPYSLMNNRRVIDAVFIRDYHGDDSTMFASGSNKNGMTPADWQCPVAQSIPDKNEILDMFCHVRRNGPNPTDALWMFGGVSIESTTGDRYFDFEMYQTDIYYDRPSQRFYGYGPDAGHTAWRFNASGGITRPGDIIFTAEFGTAALNLVEARIWIDRASLSITPTGFDWTGSFDGADNGAQYGYAGIRPKGSVVFYTGLASPANTWTGPFGLILGDNSYVTSYTARQFMEFSVDLTTLGLDPVTLLGGNACGMPFRRILVKSRASSSFTAALKDFVGPFDFFLAPRANVAADVPIYCGVMGVSELQVTNAIATSIYTWTTPDGHIVSSTTGPQITVDAPGTYIVTQQLSGGCSVYATDTISILFDSTCVILESKLLNFDASKKNKQVNLQWTVSQNKDSRYFDVQRSTDGENFTTVARVNANPDLQVADYTAADDISGVNGAFVYYRLKMKSNMGYIKYSKVIPIALSEFTAKGISIAPNPIQDVMRVSISSDADKQAEIQVYDFAGRLVRTHRAQVAKGNNTITLNGFKDWQKGIYAVKVMVGDEGYIEKVILTR